MNEHQATKDGALDEADIKWLIRQIAMRPDGLGPLDQQKDEHGLRAWRKLGNLLLRMQGE